MRRTLLGTALGMALLGISWATPTTTPTVMALAPETPQQVVLSTCQEDMPCWTWSTMGNRTRGVVTMHGTPKVVTCGGMRHLIKTGNLDPFTPRLKGDARCGRTRAYDRRVKAQMQDIGTAAYVSS